MVPEDLEFTGYPPPSSDSEKRLILASPTALVSGQPHGIGFETILRSGEQRGTGVFGKLYDMNGAPILATDGSSTISDVVIFRFGQFKNAPRAENFFSLVERIGATKTMARKKESYKITPKMKCRLYQI